MSLEEIVSNIDPRWRKDFLDFVNTGEGSDEFLAYLDNDPEGQQAVEMAFTAQAKAFEGLAEEFRKPAFSSQEEVTAAPAVLASESLTQAVEDVARLPYEERLQAVQQTVSSLGSSLKTDQQKAAYGVVRSLETALSECHSGIP
jgi:hypothetical protein